MTAPTPDLDAIRRAVNDLFAALNRSRAEVARLRETLAAPPTDAEVEAGARGLFLHDYPGNEGAWDAPGDAGKASWKSRARAALTAAYAARREASDG